MEFTSDRNMVEEIFGKVVQTMQENNRDTEEVNANLDDLGQALNKFIKTSEKNALELREIELEKRRQKEDEPTFVIDGLGKLMDEPGGFFGTFLGVIGFFFRGLLAFFVEGFSTALRPFGIFGKIFNAQDPDKGLGRLRFRLMLGMERMRNFFTNSERLTRLFAPLTAFIEKTNRIFSSIIGTKNVDMLNKFFRNSRGLLGWFSGMGAAIGGFLGRAFPILTGVIAAFDGLQEGFGIFTDKESTFEKFKKKGASDFDAFMVGLIDGTLVGVLKFFTFTIGGLADLASLILLSPLRLFEREKGGLLDDIITFSFIDFFDDISEKIRQFFIFDSTGTMAYLERLFYDMEQGIIDFFSQIIDIMTTPVTEFFDLDLSGVNDAIRYLMNLPEALAMGMLGAANIFGEGTFSERFNTAFREVMEGEFFPKKGLGMKFEMINEQGMEVRRGSLIDPNNANNPDLLPLFNETGEELFAPQDIFIVNNDFSNSNNDNSQNSSGGFFGFLGDFNPFSNNETTRAQ